MVLRLKSGVLAPSSACGTLRRGARSEKEGLFLACLGVRGGWVCNQRSIKWKDYEKFPKVPYGSLPRRLGGCDTIKQIKELRLLMGNRRDTER